MRAIVPVFVSELKCDNDLDKRYCDFVKGGTMPTCCHITVKTVQTKPIEHLNRLGKGPPCLPATTLTVKGTLSQIVSLRGANLCGNPQDALDKGISHITQLGRYIREARFKRLQCRRQQTLPLSSQRWSMRREKEGGPDKGGGQIGEGGERGLFVKRKPLAGPVHWRERIHRIKHTPTVVLDAKSIKQCVDELGRNKSQIVANPMSKSELKRGVQDFVRSIDRDQPPRITLVFYVDHGM